MKLGPEGLRGHALMEREACASVLQQVDAQRGQRGALASRAQNQRSSEGILKGADLLADGGLGNAQLVRCATHAAAFGKGHEYLELALCRHGHRYRTMAITVIATSALAFSTLKRSLRTVSNAYQ